MDGSLALSAELFPSLATSRDQPKHNCKSPHGGDTSCCYVSSGNTPLVPNISSNTCPSTRTDTPHHPVWSSHGRGSQNPRDKHTASFPLNTGSKLPSFGSVVRYKQRQAGRMSSFETTPFPFPGNGPLPRRKGFCIGSLILQRIPESTPWTLQPSRGVLSHFPPPPRHLMHYQITCRVATNYILKKQETGSGVITRIRRWPRIPARSRG